MVKSQKKPLHLMNLFLLIYLNLITWVSKKNQLQNPKLIIIPPRDCNTILEMFELLENPNPIVIEDVHCFNFKK